MNPERAKMEAEEDAALAEYERIINSTPDELGMTKNEYDSAHMYAWDKWKQLKNRDRPIDGPAPTFDRNASHTPDGKPRFGWA